MSPHPKADPTPRPLEGIRVLDLTRVMSGPFCTAMLADLGAEVIKLEMPGVGDTGRLFAPHIDGESVYFNMLNRGKQSITVQLKDPAGVEIVRDLIRCSDVVVENFRPGVLARLGLDYPSVRDLRPEMIYTSITGFGAEGQFAQLPAFDLVIQAMSGLMSITGERNGATQRRRRESGGCLYRYVRRLGHRRCPVREGAHGQGTIPGSCHAGLRLFDAAYGAKP